MNFNIENPFGVRLLRCRLDKKLTQAELSELIDINDCMISRWELGESLPSIQSLIKLAKALKVSSDFLLGLTPEETIDISGLTKDEKGSIWAIVQNYNAARNRVKSKEERENEQRI